MYRLNAAEMFVDVSKEGGSTSTNWVAESGVLDLFLLLGPSPRQVNAIRRVAQQPCTAQDATAASILSDSVTSSLSIGRQFKGAPLLCVVPERPLLLAAQRDTYRHQFSVVQAAHYPAL